jgi:hypothetical protein
MEQKHTLAGPFSGLLVIDLTHVLNGPFATMLRSDLGARIIKIEQPGIGDETRNFGPLYKNQSVYFDFVNRGKESIALNPKDPKDRDIFLRMVRKAEVLTENFRPGVMARLGLSYDEVSKINPRLIYASSTGFGQTGPLATYPAYDTIIQAMSGIMSMTGFPDGPPTKVEGPPRISPAACFCSVALQARSMLVKRPERAPTSMWRCSTPRLCSWSMGLWRWLHTRSPSRGPETGIRPRHPSMCSIRLTTILPSVRQITASSAISARPLGGRN